jgi:hypothetical protein
VANRKTTILAVTSLVAGALVIIYQIQRHDFRQTQRHLAGDGEFGESIIDEPSESGTFKRLDISDGSTLVIEDASGKEMSFVCYDNCSPLDENTESYIGKRVRVFWLATSDESDPMLDPGLSGTPSASGSTPTSAPATQERIAVRIELLSQ